MVGGLGPSTSGVVVSATASARPVLTFRNFSLRCDKSDPRISFKVPWNWEIPQGKKIAIITNSSFLRYQLIAGIAGLVPPVSGDLIAGGVVGWPVGGSGGLDSKLRISHSLNFLKIVYGDCLEKSCVSLDEFWALLLDQSIYPNLTIKELSKDQKEFFYLALSVLFSFDCYLVPQSKFLMSKAARQLRKLLLKQVEGKTIIATSSNGRFRSDFCSEGLVLNPYGGILYSGGLSESIEWAKSNLKLSDDLEKEDEQLQMGLDLQNASDDLSSEDM